MLRSTTSETVTLSYNDIIFQARNRSYGAFDLRQNYRPNLTRALGIGVGLFMMGLTAPTLYGHFFKADRLDDRFVSVQTNLVKLPDPPATPSVPLPPVEETAAVNTVRNVPPVVMPEADVVEDNLPPTTDQLKNATSGTETAESTGDPEIIATPETSTPTIIERAIEIEPKNEAPFTTVEQQPEYPGGLDALRTFLSANLKYPRVATAAGVSGRIYISFIVNTDGTLTDIQVLKGIGFGCDEEAVRVVQKMPRWHPGKQSGRAVRVKYNLPISFTLE